MCLTLTCLVLRLEKAYTKDKYSMNNINKALRTGMSIADLPEWIPVMSRHWQVFICITVVGEMSKYCEKYYHNSELRNQYYSRCEQRQTVGQLTSS